MQTSKLYQKRRLAEKKIEILDKKIELQKLKNQLGIVLEENQSHISQIPENIPCCPIPDTFHSLGEIFDPQKNAETLAKINDELMDKMREASDKIKLDIDVNN